MLKLLLNWHFPPIPMLLAIGSLWVMFRENPRTWSSAITCVPVLGYLNTNVFAIYFSRTPISISAAVAATAVPCLCLSFFLMRRLRVKSIGNPKFSRAKAALYAICGLAFASVVAYGAAYVPADCTTPKCEFGVSLFGSLDYCIVWFACVWSGMMASVSLLALYAVISGRWGLPEDSERR
ncbi:hypothetical protein AMC78_PC00051 (plasmid) [Rhizobium phaseoli]|nr:hypothetical protein AMC78_PC00051 [Rhizobium phaseoli]